MSTQSKINPILTLDYIVKAAENKLFDRKSAKTKASELAPLISAFANAEGGTIVIGVSDKSRELEGLNGCDTDKINNFIAAPKEYCKPMPRYEEEFLNFIHPDGKSDKLLLLHIEASPDQIIRTSNDSTFLRIGDKTKEIKGNDLRNLEYGKRFCFYTITRVYRNGQKVGHIPNCSRISGIRMAGRYCKCGNASRICNDW